MSIIYKHVTIAWNGLVIRLDRDLAADTDFYIYRFRGDLPPDWQRPEMVVRKTFYEQSKQMFLNSCHGA